MRKLTAVFFILIATMASANQNDLVKKLHEAYADVQYFEASFVQEKTVKFLSKPLVSKGHIKFSKKHGMIWEITKPIWVKTKINKNGIFKTSQFHQNKKVTDVQMKVVAQILSELLSSQLDRIESQFSISELTLNDENNSWQVTLSASSILIKKAIKALNIMGNLENENQSKGISRIEIIDPSQNITVITFIDVKLSDKALGQDVIDDFQ